MLRTLLIIIALVIVVVIGLVATGMLRLNQTQEAQAPSFDVEVSPVEVGTTTRNVQVPAVEMKTRQVEVPTVRVGGNEAESPPANAQ